MHRELPAVRALAPIALSEPRANSPILPADLEASLDIQVLPPQRLEHHRCLATTPVAGRKPQRPLNERHNNMCRYLAHYAACQV